MLRLPASISLALLLVLAPALADEAAAGGGALRAGHSHDGEAFNEGPRQLATRVTGTGEVHFPIQSSWPEAQAWFDQGIGQLHGFWYFEAERTFRHIAARDPDCAMAYWGMAMANWENPKRATGFIAKAVEHREKAGEAAKMWIDAQNAYLTSAGTDDLAKRRQLIRDLEKIIHTYPEDIEAKAFLACRIWHFSRMGIPINSHESVDALLQQVLAKSPMHPAHHYRIHLWDEEKAARALDSAALLAQTAPGIAHMWHMPGHIYSRLLRYDDSAWHQQASARVDHRQMLEHRILPDQIHNYVHNNEWLIRNFHMLGSGHEALAIAKSLLSNPRHPVLNQPADFKSSVAFGRLRLLETLEQFELWDEAIHLADTSYLDQGSSEDDWEKRARLLGIARFEKGELPLLNGILHEVASKRAAVEAEREAAHTKARELAVAEKKDEKATSEAVASAGNPFDERIRKLTELHAELDAHVAILESRPDPALAAIKRSKQVMARLHLRLGKKEDALRLSKEAVDAAPGQTLPLAARIEILQQCGDAAAAREAFAQLKPLSAGIDLSAPPFLRLAGIAAQLGEPPDWRIPAFVRDDVSPRPALATLGPPDWTPPPAPDFSLPDASGQLLGLAQLKGKPVVVLFYLGHGCLHCVDQLNAFAPKRGDFLQAGIEMVAISSDPVEELKESQLAYSEQGFFPFPIIADPSLHAFKSYRAYDDFENKPLHGTFLIDGAGRILWQDIAAEPFSNPGFLLDEAKRLLEIHADRPSSELE
jgi:peroxiredoxin